MFVVDIFLLIAFVILGVFLTGRLTPFVIVFINRLLVVDIDPWLILLVCVFAAFVGDTLLWYFDRHIHSWLERKWNIKKKTEPILHKKGLIKRISHELWERMQFITNKNIMFWAISCASFSIIPDFFVVEFSRDRMRFKKFALAMALGKLFSYVPLVWGSIGFLEMVKNFV